MKTPQNPAFEQWLRSISNNDIKQAAQVLKDMAKLNPGKLAWQYLQATGDPEYTDETFLKAAQIALRNAERKV